jgi:dTDP-L-rhamnose 4-epimerase
MHILITGGAGFVGSFLAEALQRAGEQVRIFDSLDPQVHPAGALNLHGLASPSVTMPHRVEVIQGDMRNTDQVRAALVGVEAVVHFAAQVGVGQSMYDITRYVDQNVTGTAVLLELLAEGQHRVRRIVIASSMAIYGEGAYRCARCGDVTPVLRRREQMRRGHWEVRCPICDGEAVPRPTPETKRIAPTSVYAITKQAQEELCLTVGRAYDIPTVALRFFNIYGPRQALSNPYTGLAAIFTSRLLNGRSPVVFEDGGQSRDFVHVSDAVQATMLALSHPDVGHEVFNVGTGCATSVLGVAELLAERLRYHGRIQVEHTFREGDIRHCFADIGAIQARLGFVPKVRLEEGIDDLIIWARTEHADDHFDRAAAELAARGLTR